jgi:hypothetical protein
MKNHICEENTSVPRQEYPCLEDFQSKIIGIILEIPKLLEVIPGFPHEIDWYTHN